MQNTELSQRRDRATVERTAMRLYLCAFLHSRGGIRVSAFTMLEYRVAEEL